MKDSVDDLTEVEKHQIESCMLKMQTCPIFKFASRQYNFLRYLVDHTLNGNQDRLKGYTIAVEVFDRPSDFDPGLDSIVRVEAGKLRAKLREYYELYGQADAIRFIIPKGSYAVEINFNDSLSNPVQHESITTEEKPSIEVIPSLAVLPFINLSSYPEKNSHLIDGLVDNVIFLLSRLTGLFVISRQSSFTYRDSNASSQEIGSGLGVSYLVDGTFQQINDNLRVTVNLIEASSGRHHWSDRYDFALNDIFLLQDKVALNIVKALKIKLSMDEGDLFGKEATSSIEAHEALLRGLECHWKYTPVYIGEARKHFAKAIKCDPSYAAAHAWLARSITHQWIMKWENRTGLLKLAMQHAQTAVELSPRHPYALAILGWVHLWHKHLGPSINFCREAVSLDHNNSELLNFLSMALSSAGYGEEALLYIQKAIRLNPHSNPFYEFVLGQAYFVLEDYEKAEAAYLNGCKLSATFIPNHVYLCAIYAHLGRKDKMREKREDVMQLIGNDKSKIIEPPWTNKKKADFYEHLLSLTGIR